MRCLVLLRLAIVWSLVHLDHLTEASDNGKTINVSSIGMAEVAAVLSSLAGTTISYVPTSAAELESAMVRHGMAAPMARLLVSIDEGIAAGHLDVASTAVEDLTGSEPTSVAAFLRANAAALSGRGS